MVDISDFPPPYANLTEKEIVDKIVDFATSPDDPSTWRSGVWRFFNSELPQIGDTPIDSIYFRMKESAYERIESLNPDKRYREILERQRVEIVQHSRDLAEQAINLGEKTVSIALVKEYKSKIKPQLLLPDAQKILRTRSNFVMQGLRD